jgi:hypothetical protein
LIGFILLDSADHFRKAICEAKMGLAADRQQGSHERFRVRDLGIGATRRVDWNEGSLMREGRRALRKSYLYGYL